VVDPDDVFGYGTQGGTQGDVVDDTGAHENQRTLVWGTTVEVREDGARFKRFLEFFELPNRPDVPHYHRALVECFERENYQLDLDCQHLEAYDPGLYKKLVSYPQEMVPLFDQVANEHFAERVLPPGEELFTRVQVRTFNLKETRAMRDLNPSDIDKLSGCAGHGHAVLVRDPRPEDGVLQVPGVRRRAGLDVRRSRARERAAA
jgi:DNA replication licensing factor MCM4